MHAGSVTLDRMELAENYNAWIGEQFRPYLGRRVLEVGAGKGTITEQLARGRELLIALEMEEFYVEQLKRRFAGRVNVKPYLSGVELADWRRLQGEKIDTVVLSNVLEHIEDDAQAIRHFRLVLPEGGRLLLWVPALPKLRGAIDDAIGHYRRYTKDSLRAVVEGNGFRLERLDWMNLLGIPGWYLNSVLLRRQTLPELQVKLYDRVAPLVGRMESRLKMPIGMSLFAVAKAV